MKTRVQFTILALCVAASALGEDGKKDLDVEFDVVRETLLQRAKDDDLRTALITDAKGLTEFLKAYDFSIEVPHGFSEAKALVVGFSDKTLAVTADGFRYIAHGGAPAYYLNVHWAGKLLDLGPAGAGKKHSGVVVIAVSNKLKIERLYVREAADGPFKRFGE
jgi:hypothetical protein